MNPLTKVALGLVKFYRTWHNGRPSPCRFTPSCSEYALEALETHGFLKGIYLTARRLLRCAPWGGWGADPVPMKISAK